MTTPFTEGWDMYPNSRSTWNARWTLVGGNGDDITTTGRFGGRAWQTFYSDQRRAGLPTSAAAGSCGFAYTQASSYGSATIFNLLESGTEHIRLAANSDGSVTVSRAGTSLGSSAAAKLSVGVYAYIEIVYTIADSTGGAVEVWINGVKEIDVSGVDTRNGGTSGVINQIQINGAGTGRNATFDDIYHVDGARWGEGRIETLYPNADTAQKDWTPNSGANNYSRVSETSGFDSDTTYISSATAGNKDIYDLSALSSTPAAIKAVTPFFVGRKDDATTRTVRTGVKSNSTTVNGTTQGMASGYTVYRDPALETDPDTTAAWTASGVNSLQSLIEVVS